MPRAARLELDKYTAAFWARTVRVGECLEWTGPRWKNGYGHGGKWVKGSSNYTHRAAYILSKGPIPAGLVIDHLCRNRVCINPAHLEVVTQAENVHRGVSAQKTHCKRGHEYTPENTRRYTNGRRVCGECTRVRARGYWAARKAA